MVPAQQLDEVERRPRRLGLPPCQLEADAYLAAIFANGLLA